MKSHDNAKLKTRFMALLIDYLVIAGYALVLFAINMLIYSVFLGGVPYFSELGMNLVSLSLILPVLMYHILMESGKSHATLGKRKQHIRVASITAAPVRFRQIVIRNIIKFLPWQLAHMAIFHAFTLQWQLSPLWSALLIITDLLPLLWLAFLFRKDHRALHDLIAKTVVVIHK